jgi:hypothetical protein
MNLHRCECSTCTERGERIEHLRSAKNEALKRANEHAIEANGLRAQLASARKAIDAMCDHLEAADPFGDHVTRNELQAWRDLLTDEQGK